MDESTPPSGYSLSSWLASSTKIRHGWYVRKSNFEALLDILQHLLVLLAADKRDGQTLGAETTSTTDAVQVGVGIGRQVVVDSQVDTLDIDTTSEDVSSNADTLVEFLEFLVAFDTR